MLCFGAAEDLNQHKLKEHLRSQSVCGVSFSLQTHLFAVHDELSYMGTLTHKSSNHINNRLTDGFICLLGEIDWSSSHMTFPS